VIQLPDLGLLCLIIDVIVATHAIVRKPPAPPRLLDSPVHIDSHQPYLPVASHHPFNS